MVGVRNEETLEKLIDALSQNGGDVYVACKKANCSVSFVSAWRRSDPKIDASIQDAIDAGTSVIESAVIKRAVKGVREPIFHQGVEVGFKRKYSDSLAEFVLKARKPGVYGTKIDVNKTVTIQTLSDKEIDERIAQLQETLGLIYQPIPEAEFEEVLELDDLL